MKKPACFILLLILLFPASSLAQPQSADEKYLALVERVLKGDKSVYMGEVRKLYARTSFYDPYGADKIWAEVKARGIEAAQKGSPEAKAAYRDTLKKHFGHHRAHTASQAVYDEYEVNFIDRGFHVNIFREIVDSILDSGDGESAETAYQVIDQSEQYMIWRTYYRLDLEERVPLRENGHIYDVLKLVNQRTNESLTMHFNIDAMATPGNKNIAHHKQPKKFKRIPSSYKKIEQDQAAP